MNAPLEPSTYLTEQELKRRVIRCLRSVPPRNSDLLKYMLVFRQQTERKLCEDLRVFNFAAFAKQVNERVAEYGLEIRKLSSAEYPDHAIWQLVGKEEA